jgi:hypothetical protein
MPGNTMEVVAEKSIRIFIFQLFRLYEISDQLKSIQEAYESSVSVFSKSALLYAECGELGITRFGTCNQLYAGSLQALPVG